MGWGPGQGSAVRMPSGAPGAAHPGTSRPQSQLESQVQGITAPAAPLQPCGTAAVNVVIAQHSTAQHIPSPSSGWGEEWLRAGTICFFHWK